MEDVAKIIKKIINMNWSDYFAIFLIIASGVLMGIVGFQWLKNRDKKTLEANKAAACGLHDWEWNGELKQFRCKKCDFTAGTENVPENFD